MKKKILLITSAVVLALALTIPLADVALAQAETEDTAAVLRPALAIRAPAVAKVGEKVTMRVVERHTGRPVYKAGVWAVEVNNIAVAVDANNAEAVATVAQNSGHFLGWTDRKGIVTHRFKDAGGYILVAIKDRYIPGFAGITIRPVEGLTVNAPDVARVGQLVTIKVTEGPGNKPVAEAAVFAVNIQDSVSTTNSAEAYAEIARSRGHLIGVTDRNGEVTHRFRQGGRYLLVALKDGYLPDFTSITIRPLLPVPAEPKLVPEQTSAVAISKS